jgi:hypothetical protein
MDEKMRKLLKYIRDNQEVDCDNLTPEYGWSISTIVLLDGIAEIFGLPKEEMVKMVTTDKWRKSHV